MKKVIIIGGGIAGLSAGIFAQKNGFESIIYEKHSILGGECTGWDRRGFHIDGCIHYLTGTDENTNINKLWQATGALGNVEIFKSEKLLTIEYQNQQISFYRDYEKLRSHLIEVSPIDEIEINNLIKYINIQEKFSLPSGKPIDIMKVKELVAFGKSVTKEQRELQKTFVKVNVAEYTLRFKSPLIRKLLCSIISPLYSVNSLLFILASFMSGNSDYPLGGSRAFAQRMVKKYLSLGGKIIVNTEVSKIIVSNKKALGIVTSNGNKDYAQYIIPACDINITYNKLLDGKYQDKKFTKRYKMPSIYPLNSCIYIALAVDDRLLNYPQKLIFEVKPFTIGNKKYNEIPFHNYNYENFAPPGQSLVICSITTDQTDYLYWKNLYSNYSVYRNEKLNVAKQVIERIEARFSELKDKISILDVATPITYERYCNAYQGAWMSFMSTPKAKMMLHNGRIEGIKNIYMASQWLIPPGGLAVAMITGKWAIERICKKEKIEFKI